MDDVYNDPELEWPEWRVTPCTLGPSMCKLSNADPRRRPRILSQPMHRYRFLKVLSNGACSTALFDRISRYSYGTDASVDSYLMSARNETRDILRGILGDASFTYLISGTESQQGEKLVELVNRNDQVASAIRAAGVGPGPVKPLRIEEMRYEIDAIAVAAAVAPPPADPSLPFPANAQPVGLMKEDLLAVYSQILSMIQQKLLLAPKTYPEDSAFSMPANRLVYVLEFVGEHKFHFRTEVCAYRAPKPFGFHLIVDAVLLPGARSPVLTSCWTEGEILSDHIMLLQPGVREDPLAFSSYFFGG